jgi:mRNA interferase MazF
MVIRGGIYQIDLGRTRGHEQRGRRYGLVVSPTDLALSVATVIPTSTRAGASVFRPTIEIEGQPTLLLIDQIRSIDTDYIGELVGMATGAELEHAEQSLVKYLGIKLESEFL